MGVRINLLPPEILARREQKRKQRRLVFIGCGCLAVFLMVYGALYFITVQTKSTVQCLREERLALESSMQGFDRYKEFQARVDQARTLVQGISDQSRDWVGFWGHVVSCMPPGVWITEISVGLGRKAGDNPAAGEKNDPKPSAGDGVPLIISGFSNSSGDFGQWLKDLEEVPGLSGVQCGYVTNTGQSGGSGMQFEITGILDDSGTGSKNTKETGNGGKQEQSGKISMDDINNTINNTLDVLNSSAGNGP